MRVSKKLYLLSLVVVCASYGYWVYSKREPPKPPELQWQWMVNQDVEEAFCSQIAKDIERFKESPSTFRRVSYNTMLSRSEAVVRAGVGLFSQMGQIPESFPRSYKPEESKERFAFCHFDVSAWLKLPALLEEQSKETLSKVAEDSPKAHIPSKQMSVVANRRLALVIGNAAYINRPLANPINDADDISNALEVLGFDVVNVRDASLRQMKDAIVEFGDRLANYDVGLVYYSGHGVEVGGRNFLIPVSNTLVSEDEVADRAIDASLIIDKLSQAKKKVNILILDACRDNPLRSRTRSSSSGLSGINAPVGTLVAFSTAPGRVAEDGTGRNSPYTKRLIENMLKPNIPIEKVFKETREAVIEETKGRQVPWENTSLRGDFYFKQ